MTAYADTSWWVAYKNSSDRHHTEAVQYFDDHSDGFVIWTPWQRVEVFNSFRQLERMGSLPKRPAIDFIRALEKEIRLGYWPHVEFSWTDTVRAANELSAVHSRDLPIRAMDLFHIAIACETGADEFLTFDEDQANLAGAAGLTVWIGKEYKCQTRLKPSPLDRSRCSRLSFPRGTMRAALPPPSSICTSSFHFMEFHTKLSWWTTVPPTPLGKSSKAKPRKSLPSARSKIPVRTASGVRSRRGSTPWRAMPWS